MSEKKVSDYSKETLVEYIEKHLSFAGASVFDTLDCYEKWRKVEKLQAKMDANWAAQDATSDWSEKRRLSEQWTKMFERQCALTK